MADARFKVGLLGAGYVSEFHVAALRRIRNAQIIGVADLDFERAARIRDGLKLPAAFGSLRELLEAGAEVIHVLTPPATHAQCALEALRGGCHVLVEKPLAASVEDCQRIEATAEECGKSVCVNHSNLRDPFVMKALDLVKRGAIGEVIGASYLRSSSYPPYLGGKLPPQYRDGGYPFRDMGVHGLYILKEILGDIEDVSAQFISQGGDPNLFFDEWAATVRCTRGLGQIRLSWNVKPLQNQLVIEGTRGVIRADMFTMYVTCRRSSRLPNSVERILNGMVEAAQIGAQVPANVLRFTAGRIRRFHGLQTLVAEFYQSLADKGRMPVTIQEAMPVVRWTEHISRQADAEKTRLLDRYRRPLRPKILVTGASGFIGRHLVSRLLEQKQDIRILVRRLPSDEMRENPHVEVVIGDLGDPDVVDRAVEGIDVVYHLGAAMRGPKHDFQRGTVVGTQNIVASVLRHKASKLIYVSSLSVLHAAAANRDAMVREDWPQEVWPESRGIYSKSKLLAEQIVTTAVREQGLPAVILRPGQVFGAGGPLLTSAVAWRLGKSLVILGRGDVPLPLIYVEDLVDAVLAATKADVTNGSVFHLVDSAKVDQNELAARFARSGRERLKLRHLPLWFVYALAAGVQSAFMLLRRNPPLSPYRVRSALSKMRFECSAAHQQLSWQPRVGVAAGLDRVFASPIDTVG